jgi:histidine triad (HIT) family protein
MTASKKKRSKRWLIVGLIFIAGLVIGRVNPAGSIYWKLAEMKLPEIKEESLSSESPFESITEDKWIAESENAFVVHNIEPEAPIHLLVIPKERVTSILEASPALISEMMQLARDAAKEQGIAEDGFRIVINTNPKGAQTVYHMHIHVLGGRQMRWPPG